MTMAAIEMIASAMRPKKANGHFQSSAALDTGRGNALSSLSVSISKALPFAGGGGSGMRSMTFGRGPWRGFSNGFGSAIGSQAYSRRPRKAMNHQIPGPSLSRRSAKDLLPGGAPAAAGWPAEDLRHVGAGVTRTPGLLYRATCKSYSRSAVQEIK